jgi:hypothetical protein
LVDPKEEEIEAGSNEICFSHAVGSVHDLRTANKREREVCGDIDSDICMH